MKMNPRKFAEIVGRKKMAHVLDVTIAAVGNAVLRGCFPASWRDGCEYLSRVHGIDCPSSMFAMRDFKKIDEDEDAA